jgi:hypothetical protein
MISFRCSAFFAFSLLYSFPRWINRIGVLKIPHRFPWEAFSPPKFSYSAPVPDTSSNFGSFGRAYFLWTSCLFMICLHLYAHMLSGLFRFPFQSVRVLELEGLGLCRE